MLLKMTTKTSAEIVFKNLRLISAMLDPTKLRIKENKIQLTRMLFWIFLNFKNILALVFFYTVNFHNNQKVWGLFETKIIDIYDKKHIWKVRSLRRIEKTHNKNVTCSYLCRSYVRLFTKFKSFRMSALVSPAPAFKQSSLLCKYV